MVDIHAPLLCQEELSTLAAQATHWPATAHAIEAHEHHAGDWPSTMLGRGLDFEEARPYAPGDDLRDMDWRSTARLGHPFVKTYREERQPVWHIVLDRRPSMRFGTRKRLKVTQAARAAVLLTHAGLNLGLAIGATLWDQQDTILQARHGDARALELLQAYVAACPPLWSLADQETRLGASTELSPRLQALRTELPRGAHVWFVTDADGLTEAALPALAALSAWTRLSVIRISDPAEVELPSIGLAAFRHTTSPVVHWLDTGKVAVRDALHAQWSARRADQNTLLRRCGLLAIDISTTTEDLLPELQHHG